MSASPEIPVEPASATAESPIGSGRPFPAEAEPPLSSVLEAALAGLEDKQPLSPPIEQPAGEFEIPPAPPLTTASLSTQPVTPDYAHPAPRIRNADDQAMPSLPTRLPGDGPDGGPDRLAPTPVPTVIERTPLPTRSRDDANESPADISPIDELRPAGAGQDEPPLDPDALRDRLRSFQAEFQSALDDGSADPISHHDRSGPNDPGGDRR